MSNEIINAGTNANQPTADQTDGQENKAHNLLVFVWEDEKQSAIELSDFQEHIAMHSLFRPDGDGNAVPYSETELLRSKDRKTALNHLLHSIDEAAEMLRKTEITASALVFNPEQEDEHCLHLSWVQFTVVAARLGLVCEKEKTMSLKDTVLHVIYGPDWEQQVAPELDTDSKKAASHTRLMAGMLTPAQIKKALDKTIIGQEHVKMKLATAVYEQELAARLNERNKHDKDFVPINRKNFLMHGPSGTGKTAMIKKLGTILDRPVAIIDSTRLTPAGYEGSSADSILRELLVKADGDEEKASHGIVYLDEWDKSFLGATGLKDVGAFKGSAASFELLRMMDGCDVTFEVNRRHVTINTENILFVLGGAFPNLDKIMQERMAKKSSLPAIGFAMQRETQEQPADADVADATLEDLKAYGIPTEALGRIATICRLHPLEKEDLVKILARSDQSPLQEYKKIFSALNVTLDMTPKAMETVAELAMKRNLGARGLGTILGNVLYPVMYKIGGNRKHLKLKLDSDCFTQGVSPALLPARRRKQA
jgi:ATP-dependent Clp protease ATP-binding subunit ClpX